MECDNLAVVSYRKMQSRQRTLRLLNTHVSMGINKYSVGSTKLATSWDVRLEAAWLFSEPTSSATERKSMIDTIDPLDSELDAPDRRRQDEVDDDSEEVADDPCADDGEGDY